MDEVEITLTIETVTCPECGETNLVIEGEARPCWKCGAKLEGDDE